MSNDINQYGRVNRQTPGADQTGNYKSTLIVARPSCYRNPEQYSSNNFPESFAIYPIEKWVSLAISKDHPADITNETTQNGISFSFIFPNPENLN